MLAPGKIYINTALRITANFTNDAGVAVNPATVSFRTMSPCGVEATYVYGTNAEIQRPAAGYYTADITPDTAGRWRYRWEPTGDGTTIANEDDFIVQDSAFFDWRYGDYA